MSHFTQVKTQIRNRRILERALSALGYNVVTGSEGISVRGFMGDTQAAEFKITTSAKGYDIGFQADEAGNYSLVGDWELLPKVADLKQEDFLAQVKREYAKQTVLQTAKEKGYEVQMEEKDGTLEMVVVSW